jgi:hypothetical protein
MNDKDAEECIFDHKFLLDKVDYKCATAYFSVIHRNQPLYNALVKHCIRENESENGEKEGLEWFLNQ